ncbi:MAG TPA: hypothetical protein VEB67_00310, partial [Nitrososphaerales archaeon]|nr:hypothetical protein [Nitrososphaerales archaeon]
MRTGFLVVVGAIAISAGTVSYGVQLASVSVPNQSTATALTGVADAYFVALLAGIGLILAGLRGIVRQRVEEIGESGKAYLSSSWMIPYLLSLSRYRKLFVATALIYGAVFAVLTSVVVYQPGVDFSSSYGASIPSVEVVPISGATLSTPILTAYVTEHFGVLLIPLTVMLLVAVSGLVGLNFIMSAFAFDSRAKGDGRGWLGGVGALVGLFTGCPTCAGLFFANILGGAGAVSFVTIVGSYQPVFVLASIPVLLVT